MFLHEFFVCPPPWSSSTIPQCSPAVLTVDPNGVPRAQFHLAPFLLLDRCLCAFRVLLASR